MRLKKNVFFFLGGGGGSGWEGVPRVGGVMVDVNGEEGLYYLCSVSQVP